MYNNNTIAKCSAWSQIRSKLALSLLAGAILTVWSHPVDAAQRYGAKFCHQEGYTCITVKKGQSWKSLFPDSYERQVVQRLNRMNTGLYAGLRIAVPKDLANTDLLDISPLPTQISPQNRKVIIVDPKSMAFGAYNAQGELVHWGPISAGQSYCRDIKRGCRTVTGSFQIYTKKGAGCKSSKYPVGKGGAPMPYCMFFHGGYALHASPTVPGYHASHGCVRLFKEDAQWLNTEFITLPGNQGGSTKVIINPYI